MGIIHHTTLVPTKLELVTSWLPGQPWFAGGQPALTRGGGFRLEDPAGEVGIEFFVAVDVTGEPPVPYLVPMTYRAQPVDELSEGADRDDRARCPRHPLGLRRQPRPGAGQRAARPDPGPRARSGAERERHCRPDRGQRIRLRISAFRRRSCHRRQPPRRYGHRLRHRHQSRIARTAGDAAPRSRPVTGHRARHRRSGDRRLVAARRPPSTRTRRHGAAVRQLLRRTAGRPCQPA